jgi:ribosomal protein S18 acetylase RimI-like enzyme
VSGPSYRVVRLSAEFDLEAFDCGEPTYNDWLVRHAAASVKAGVCAVYLLVAAEGTQTRVVGYYAISPAQLVRDDAPHSMTRGWPHTVPAWRLGKLAVHVDLRADTVTQWGRQLLRHAVETIVGVAEAGGGKVIIVDADNPGLLGFYQRNGFRSTGMDGDLSLYLKVSTARKVLGASAGR